MGTTNPAHFLIKALFAALAAAAAMEALLERVHKSALWRDYSQKNMYEDRWMNGAEFARYLHEQRAAQQEFIDSIGLAKKP